MVCSADGVDWSEKVFQWEELFEGPNRYERVQEFCQTIRKQLFVRIVSMPLPRAGRLSAHKTHSLCTH